MTSWGTDDPDTTAEVVEALIALGIDPQGPEWTKNGHSLVDALLTYQQPDGSFTHQGSWTDDEGTHAYTANDTAYILDALADVISSQDGEEFLAFSKYQHSFPLRIMAALQAPDSLAAGQDCDLSIRIVNPQESEQSFLVIAALYEPGEPDKMVTYAYGQYDLDAGEEQIVGLGFKIYSDADSRVQIMVWDNWSDQTPLCSEIVIPVMD
jgi:hypothetical protein